MKSVLNRTLMIALASCAALTANAADSMSQKYATSTAGFGKDEAARKNVEAVLSAISDSSKGALSFEMNEGTAYHRHFGVVVGKDFTLAGNIQVNSDESAPAPGASMTQKANSQSFNYNQLVASTESESGKNDPTVDSCNKTAEKLMELTKNGSVAIQATCEISETSRQTKVAGPTLSQQVETPCEEAPKASQAAGSAQASAPAPAAKSDSSAQAQDQSSAQIQGSAQQSQGSVVIEAPKVCYKTVETPTERDATLISHSVNLQVTVTPLTLISTPALPVVSQSAQQEGSATPSEGSQPAQQGSQSAPAAQAQATQAQAGQQSAK